MDKEVIERLTRVEVKLDGALEHLRKIPDLDTDMKMIKRTIRFIWGAIVVIAGFFGGKSS